MITKEQLLDALDNSRESLLVAIEPLPDEALHEKQAVGEWSVADVLINITAWEAELVTGLMRIQQNKRPERLLEAMRINIETWIRFLLTYSKCASKLKNGSWNSQNGN